MLLVSAAFARLVAALKVSKKTVTVVEQCCGGLISSSITAQPGASRVYFGGTTAYNTRKSKPLLLADADLYQKILDSQHDVDPTLSAAEQYIQSKFAWTALTAVAFCEAVGTDYAIAEGGASGPTFAPCGMRTGFAVVSVAGRQSDGSIAVLRQNVIRSDHNDRERNMRYFADRAADMATEVVTGETVGEPDPEHRPASALLLDRVTHLRTDNEALAKLEESAKYVILNNNRILVNTPTQLAFLNNSEVKEATKGHDTRKTFLGMRLENPKTAVFGIDVRGDPPAIKSVAPPAFFVDTRTTAPLFDPLENALALHATALAQWQRRTLFCALCGGATVFIHGGTCGECTRCQSKSWPRQDPSMIAAISSRDGQRILLARSKRHPGKLHTVLAGFVEAGESFEAAVARETFEETGVRIDEGSVRYCGSQPWPFPQSCMIGFSATADDAAPLQIDEQEIVSASWFCKSDVEKAAKVPGATMQHSVAEAALKDDPSLPLLIPPKGVIARRLIDLWLVGR